MDFVDVEGCWGCWGCWGGLEYRECRTDPSIRVTLLTHPSQTHGSRTIEGDIFAALVKAGAVSEDNADDHRKVDVQRAARTDAGVHAAGNV